MRPFCVIFKHSMESGNAKSYVNNTNEHAVQNLHMFFYSLGRWTRKCKGMRSTLWLFLRYVDGALMCVPSFSLMQKSYCSALQSKDTKNRHFNFISKVSTSKWQENCFILSTHKGLKKMISTFFVPFKCLNESFWNDAHCSKYSLKKVEIVSLKALMKIVFIHGMVSSPTLDIQNRLS